LERWVPDEEAPGSVNNWNFSSASGASGSNSWDQFATNEKLFGVKTDFQEELYTTKLDKSSAEYLQREKEAERLAREIEKVFNLNAYIYFNSGKGSTSNVHLAEERGQTIDEGAVDEEDRYGAVVRAPGSYVPPSARRASISKQPSIASTVSSKVPVKLYFFCIQRFFKKKEEPVLAKQQQTEQPAADSQAVPEKRQALAPSKTDQQPTARKSSLNPAASSFTFNIGAASFDPVSSEKPMVISYRLFI
jgi:PAB1-binding protein PBP1